MTELLNDHIYGQVGEPLSVLVGLVNRTYSITTSQHRAVRNVFFVPPLPEGLEASYSRDTERLVVSGTPVSAGTSTHKARRDLGGAADANIWDIQVTIFPRPGQIKPVTTSLEATVGQRIDPRFVAYVLGNLRSGSLLQILTDKELPTGLRITTSVTADSNRVYISGTPTAAMSDRYTLTAQERTSTGDLIRITGSVTIKIDVRAVDPGPRPSITIAPPATKRAGVTHAAFTIATLDSFPTHAVVPEFDVFGNAFLGLTDSVTADETKLQLSGTIPRNTSPQAYTITIQYSEATRRELSALYLSLIHI